MNVIDQKDLTRVAQLPNSLHKNISINEFDPNPRETKDATADKIITSGRS